MTLWMKLFYFFIWLEENKVSLVVQELYLSNQWIQFHYCSVGNFIAKLVIVWVLTNEKKYIKAWLVVVAIKFLMICSDNLIFVFSLTYSYSQNHHLVFQLLQFWRILILNLQMIDSSFCSFIFVKSSNFKYSCLFYSLYET